MANDRTNELKNSPRVGIVIINWKKPILTLRCIQTLLSSSYQNYRIVVVENGSQDDSLVILRQSFPDLDYAVSQENLGYTGGNNLGLHYLMSQSQAASRDSHSSQRERYDYFLLLNDDLRVDEKTLGELVHAALEHPEAGFLGPKLMMEERPQTILSAGGIVTSEVDAVHRGLGETDQGQYDQPTYAQFLSGSALFVKAEVIEKTGYLDDDFFIYFDEVEWCYRARRNGYQSLFVPSARAWHPDTSQRDQGSAFVTYYTTRNSLLFARKVGLGGMTIVRLWLIYLRRLASWSLRPKWRTGANRKTAQRVALRKALLDYALGRFGELKAGRN